MTGPRRSRPARVLFLLLGIVLPAFLLTGCNEDRHPAAPREVDLRVQVLFPRASDRTGETPAGPTGAPGRTAANATDGPPADRRAKPGLNPNAAVTRITATAFELTLPDSMAQLRASASVDLAPGETHFRLVLQVPPAELYRIEVQALGSATDGEGESGVLFAGRGLVTAPKAGAQEIIEIQTAGLVPSLEAHVTPQVGYELRWSAVAGALRYRLREFPLSAEDPRDFVTTRTDTAVAFPPGKSAQEIGSAWRVRAEFPDSLFSAFSESVRVTVPGPVPPAVVRDLEIIATGPRSLTLSWTAPGDDGRQGRALSYDLRYHAFEINDLNWSVTHSVRPMPEPRTAGRRDSVTVVGLEPETRYHLALKATDDAGLESALSNRVTARTSVEAPEAPVALRAQALSPDSIALVWFDRSENEAIFEIERRGPEDSVFVPRATVPGSLADSARYADTELQERAWYAYRVRASNTGGASAYSNADSARTQIDSPLIVRLDAAGPDRVLVGWRFPEPDPDGFLLERRTGEAAFREIARPDSQARAFTDRDVAPLILYTYRIRAFEGTELSAPSPERSIRTPDAAPVCSVTPGEVLFDTLTAGQTRDRTFTVRNAGGGTLSGQASASCRHFELVGGGGSFSLGAGAHAAFLARYHPAEAGSHTCEVSLGSAVCAPVTLRGFALAAPLCSLSREVIDFGSVPVGRQSDESWTVRNTGGGVLAGTVAPDPGCAEFALVSGAGAFALAAGESLVVTARFSPASGLPQQCRILTGVPECPSVLLTGQGILPPHCTVEPPSLDFGRLDLDETAEQSFTITNDGGGLLTGTVLATCQAFDVVEGAGAFDLGTGESRSVTVRFTAVSRGTHTCTIATGGSCAPVNASAVVLWPDDHWWDGFSPSLHGMDAPVLALADDGSSLYAGGWFHRAGGTTVTGVARWSGSAWSALGPGLGGSRPAAMALGFWNRQLIVGGQFESAGGLNALNIASWDGAQWSALGRGFDASVNALTSYGADLFAGGSFLSADGNTLARYIARWSGEGWAPVGAGLDRSVRALTLFRGDLVAGGEFISAGGPVVNRVASWNGQAWLPLGTGIGASEYGEESVHALVVWNDLLVAAESFSRAGSAEVANIAAWNGVSWAPLGAGLDGPVYALTLHAGDLVATGSFSFSGDTELHQIARFDGTSWRSLGSGISDTSRPGIGFALLPFGGSLYVGGSFTFAGGKPAAYIARWDEE